MKSLLTLEFWKPDQGMQNLYLSRWKMNTNAKISAEFSVQKVLKTEKQMAVSPPETRVKNRTVEAASLSDVTAPSTLPLLTLTTA